MPDHDSTPRVPRIESYPRLRKNWLYVVDTDDAILAEIPAQLGRRRQWAIATAIAGALIPPAEPSCGCALHEGCERCVPGADGEE